MATEGPPAAKRPPAGSDADLSASQAKGVARIAVPPAVTFLVVIIVLYLGKDILLPLAIALLLTFALAPIVSLLRRMAVPRILAVIITVVIAFSVIGMLGFVIATQVTQLAQNIPLYQSNIIAKIHALRDMGGSGWIDRLIGAIQRIGQELQQGTTPPEAAAENPAADPLPVEIITRQSPIDLLKNIVVPLVSPFATVGLIVVVVIFMLLEREGLRDRFIRLVGASDLHRTTEALHDAGRRVGRYLLMQLVVNITYAIPITIGLWLLGIPNAALWGLLTLVLRFVPYIGPMIGMLLPVMVTFAVTPGWAPLLLTIGLFLAVELISNNVVEPWLYGSRTGLSPLAVIVAAIFWAWIWGPVGLVLSTPLTVCLVVLGKHVPHFEFLGVLFGNEPVLEPKARIYQRLLAGDPAEAADYAEEILEDDYLVDFYDRIGVPALLLGEEDRNRGVMWDETLARFAQSARAMVDDLEEVATEEGEELEEHDSDGDGERGPIDRNGDELPDGEGLRIACIGGRTAIDDAAAAMLAQAMKVQGAEAAVSSFDTLAASGGGADALDGVHAVVLTFLGAASVGQVRHAVRRLKRRRRTLRVGVYVPMDRTGDDIAEPPFAAETVNADFVAATMHDALIHGFADEKPVALPRVIKRNQPRRTGRGAPAAG